MSLRPQDVLSRTDRFLDHYLADAVVTAAQPLAVDRWDVPDLDDPAAAGGPAAFASMKQRAEFRPVRPKHAPWGRAWHTSWFRISGTVPSEWCATDGRWRIELAVDLGFSSAKPGFQAEGLVRTSDGMAVKGLQPRNNHVPINPETTRSVLYYVEAAANPDLTRGVDFKHPRAFAPTPLGDPSTISTECQYVLGPVEVRLVNVTVERLRQQLLVLRGLAAEMSETEPRRAQLLNGLDHALDLLDPNDPSVTAEASLQALAPLLASGATASAHTVIATGHAHIDSAWLWPARETARKVARTFANVLQLMEEDADLTFTCSSAQHLEWVKQHDPALYERVRRRVAEGRFIPVGNMWVESDVNMPSGESLARQFLYGSRFFIEEFGERSDVGWLPDSFGYSAALPQLLRKSGLRWFFAQKMCWNDTNQMPHHTFTWEGLDGTRILTHFPPVNTYSADMRPTELARAVRNFSDHEHAATSLMPFGYGDGGGGPSREMLAAGRLQGDLEGSARVRFGTARDFFAESEAQPWQFPAWMGEMYLEFHRGIYTSQARTKRGNRRNEALLVEAEAWWAAATVRCRATYPREDLDALWKELLLLQFHDILPGSSIAWVHREAERSHEEITAQVRQLIIEAVAILAGEGQQPLTVNPAPLPQAGVAAHGIATSEPQTPGGHPVVLDGGAIQLVSEQLLVVVANDGTLSSIYDRQADRELLPPGQRANVLEVHIDAPARWDAWDLDRAAVTDGLELRAGKVTVDGRGVMVQHMVSDSTIEQRISLLDDGSGVSIRTRVDWHERHRLLKLGFSLDVHAPEAAYETQFGHVRRPLHHNTSWDTARYEVCAHRWVHVAEPGFGVAVANDGLYGHDVRRTVVNGRVATLVRQSLLRAPTFPDPDADQGMHEVTSVLAPAVTVGDAIATATRLGSPAWEVLGAHGVEPLVRLDCSAQVLISAIKLAADGSGDLIVRLYESHGGRATARLRVDAPVAQVSVCDLSELDLADGVPSPDPQVTVDGAIELALRPFEVVTLRLVLDECAT